MAIKIISGMLLPTSGDQSFGSVVVNLRDGQLIEKDHARISDLKVIGTGTYVGAPAVQLSLRHIVSADEEASFNLNDELVIENGVATGVRVSWHAEPKKSKIIEISVLVIGEAK